MPARILRDAAAKLRALAADAEREVDTNPYWRSQFVGRPGWYANGVRNGLGGPSGELAAALHPGVGIALADWLERAAHAHEATLIAAGKTWASVMDPRAVAFVEHMTDRAALAVADAILGGEAR